MRFSRIECSKLVPVAVMAVLFATPGCGGSSPSKDENSGASAVKNGAKYCSGNSPWVTGPLGYQWALYGTPGACATATCTPSAAGVCASVTSPPMAKGGIATSFNGPIDLSKETSITFTAELEPAGTSFEVGIASGNGVHGMTWRPIAESGEATYEVALAEGTPFTNDGQAFVLTDVETFDVATNYETGGNMALTVTGVTVPSSDGGGGGSTQTATGDFTSCDGHGAPGEPSCTEVTGSSVPAALAAIKEQCPASMGYVFSTTARCPTSEPGCICTTGSSDLEQHVYIYQTSLQDPFTTAELLCGKAVDSCFGGLSAP